MNESLPSLLRHPAVIVWALLMLATALSWWLGLDHRLFNSTKVVTASAIMVIAFAKVYLVGMYFMDLRTAPGALRFVFSAWTLLTCAVVVGLYIGA